MDEQYMTTREYSVAYSRNNEKRYLARVGKAATAACAELGVPVGERLGKLMGSGKQYRVNTYPVSVLREVFKAVRP